jgi:hypothetical protein
MTSPRRHWRPAGDSNNPAHTGGVIPEVGAVIAILQTRDAWRVLEIDEVHQANWADQTLAAWRRVGSPPWETWDGRERRIWVEPARNAGPKDRRGLRLAPWWFGEQWRPLSDPYPTCIACDRLWPCACHDQNREAAAGLAEFERVAAIAPGCCWACGEPVTGRQKAVAFDGDNLLLPGGPTVVFHIANHRRPTGGWTTCLERAEEYEVRWVAAAPGRVARLRCPGVQFQHRTKALECSAGTACVGPRARHAEWQYCTTQVLPNGSACSGSERYPLPFRNDEIRPPTNCGAPVCRGLTPAVLALDLFTEHREDPR